MAFATQRKIGIKQSIFQDFMGKYKYNTPLLSILLKNRFKIEALFSSSGKLGIK